MVTVGMGATDSLTLSVGRVVKCPECGREGTLVLRMRKGRYYGYVYHGHQRGKKIEHYIGPAPKPDTPEFEEWVKQLETKRKIIIWLPASTVEKLAQIALSEGKDIETIIKELIDQAIKARREAKLESMLEAQHPTPQPQPSQPARRKSTGKPGLLGWMG